MDAEKYIALVQGTMSKLALHNTLHPAAKDAYSLGEANGRVQGLQIALDLLNDSLREKPNSGPAVRSGNPYLQELDEAPTLPEQYRQR